MASDILTLEQRLIRYLKTGTERSFFLPGKNKLFRSGPNAIKLMIEAGQGQEAINHMKRINTDKSYFKREPFLYFLATAVHSDNLEIKRAAYAIVNEVCETPVDLFVFLKHMKILSQLCKGWGHGLRRVICDWYNNKDPMLVAEMVTRYKEVERWSHKDVFRLSHIKPANEGVNKCQSEGIIPIPWVNTKTNEILVLYDWYNNKDPMLVAEMVTRYKEVERWSHKDVFRLSHIKPANEDPMLVAEMVTRYKEVEGWSHKDVFRLSHIKPANEGIGFIVKVVCKGLKAAKEATPEPSDTVQNLIDYFDAVELVKHSDDGATVARILEERNLSFEHIPSTILSSKEVWNSLLLKMTLKQLLGQLASLSRRGFLTIPSKGSKPDPLLKQMQERVLEKIRDKSAIETEKISPYQLYISIREYVRTFSDKKKFSKSGNAEAEPMKRSASTQTDATGDHSTKKKKKKKKKGKGEDVEEKVEAEPSVNDKAKTNNPELFEALHAAFRTAAEKNLVNTDKSYCLAVKASLSELNKGIRGIPSISPLEVMALMATFLKKKEKSAQLGFFTASYSPMKYPSDLEDVIQEIVQLAAPVPNLACDPAAPITWALEKKKKFDVFLVVSDGNEARGESSPAEKLEEYRQAMNLPNTKMIICGLTAPKLDFAVTRGMLDIGGFDVNVPTIINQFILGQLDQ